MTQQLETEQTVKKISLDEEAKQYCPSMKNYAELISCRHTEKECARADQCSKQYRHLLTKEEEQEHSKWVQPQTLNDLRATFQRWLALDDFTAAEVALACALDRKVPGDPVWTFLVAPSGGFKSELLRAITTGLSEWTVKVDSLTSKSIVSGFATKEGVAVRGLAVEANEKIVVVWDFTEILSKERNERGEIFGQMRSWYDGQPSRRYGIFDKTLTVKSTVGMVLGVTPSIDRFTGMLGQLGERFLKVRHTQNRAESRRKSLENAGKETEMRQELACATQHYMKSLCLEVLPSVSPEIVKAIGDIAELVALVRTTIPYGIGDPSSNMEVEIEAEYSTRLSKQLLKLAIMLAVVRQKSEVGFGELETILRVGLDTLPPKRFKILRELYWAEKPLSKAELVDKTGFDRWTVADSMKNLEYIGLVKGRSETDEKGTVDFYEVSEGIKAQMGVLFDEKPAEGKNPRRLELRNPVPPFVLPIPKIKALANTNGSTRTPSPTVGEEASAEANEHTETLTCEFCNQNYDADGPFHECAEPNGELEMPMGAV